MTQRQRNQLIEISWSSHEGTVRYATKLYVIVSSIIEDIFEKAAEILNSSAVIPAPGPPAGTFVVQNLISSMEPLVVIVNNSFKISCQAKSKRYHAYQICEHCLAVAGKESVLINFLAYHKKRNTSKHKCKLVIFLKLERIDVVGKRQQKLHGSVMGKVTLIGNHSRVTWQRVLRTEIFRTVFACQLDQVVLYRPVPAMW